MHCVIIFRACFTEDFLLCENNEYPISQVDVCFSHEGRGSCAQSYKLGLTDCVFHLGNMEEQ